MRQFVIFGFSQVMTLPNIFKDKKVSISEREICTLGLSFAVCRIGRVLGLYSVR